MGHHRRAFDPCRLTPREAEIAALIGEHQSPTAIAAKLGIKPASVWKAVGTIMQKEEAKALGVGE